MAKNKPVQRTWMRLDNAAKIYPASKRRDWMAQFRLSADLTEDVDPDILRAALMLTLRRFPTYAVKLRHGAFWYYLDHIDGIPLIEEDVANPGVKMSPRENGGFLFRVRCWRKRIALEVYHVLSDGTGGLCFLKTLIAEYLRLKYGEEIPRDREILDTSEPVREDETEDAFLRFERGITKSRSEPSAYYHRGTREPTDAIHQTTGMIDTEQILQKAREKGVTLTTYLVSVLIYACDKAQRRCVSNWKKLKPVKICVPVNLRKFYPETNTMRNFSNYTNPGIDSRLGEYSFDEILANVSHYIALEANEKEMNARFSTNVASEKSKILRVMPLFIKNFAMNLAFLAVGDRQTTSCISNLGNVRLPEEMAKYVTRMDFVLGPYSRNPVVCAALSYNGTLYLNFTRTIQETEIEREFFTFLVKQGIHVKVESNQTAVEFLRGIGRKEL